MALSVGEDEILLRYHLNALKSLDSFVFLLHFGIQSLN